MSDHAADRRLIRVLAAILTGLWAGTAVSVATAYRPGGPVDIVVAVACFLPVLVAVAGIAWPPLAPQHRHRVAIAWTWVAATLFAIPVLYGVASTLAAGGPQTLVPSFEAAYAGVLGLFLMSLFSILGLVHRRRQTVPLERRSTWLSAGLSVVLTVAIGAAFGFVAWANDQALRERDPASSRFGPTGAGREPPFCDEPVVLGRGAVITVEARSSLDDQARGRALLRGRRSGIDEAWGAWWAGPDGSGEHAYLRVGMQAWLNEDSDDLRAPGTTWQETLPDPFDLAGRAELTMDGPPFAVVDVPRGDIVAEDLGLEILEGARSRHCRTFIDGPTALDTFLPLRWLLYGSSTPPDEDVISRWRGEMDWWVFTDGQLGRASVEVSGSRAETDWDASGTRAVLEARLEATDRDTYFDLARAAPPTWGISSPAPSEEPDPPLQSGAG